MRARKREDVKERARKGIVAFSETRRRSESAPVRVPASSGPEERARKREDTEER